MKSFMSLVGGAMVSMLLATAVGAQMGLRFDAQIAHASPSDRASPAVVAPAVAAPRWPASQPALGPVSYGTDATASGGPPSCS